MALGVMVISSCANEGIINEMSIGGNTVSFTAGTQSDLSKTVMTDDCKIIFAGGESIAIVSDNGTLFSASNSSSTSSALAVFNAQVDKSVIDASSSFVAMYPDGVYNDGYQMELPAIQTATPNSFDPKANLLVANTTRDRMHFYFKNVCSYIEVDLPLETESVTVCSKSPLAGTIKVDAEGNITDTLNASNTVTLRGDLKPGKYCIAVLPGYKDSLVVNSGNGHLSNVSTECYYMSRGGIYSADFEEKGDGPSPSPWHPEHPEVQLLSPADIYYYVNSSDEDTVTLNMPLETYDHTDVMLEIAKITDKKVKLVIPEGVEILVLDSDKLPRDEEGNPIFPNPHALADVVIPDGVTLIGSFAFAHCISLTNLSIPSSCKSIDNLAFNFCNGLTELTIPNGVEKIGNNSFAFCYRIKNVIIPESVTEIGDGAFQGCEGITDIIIPESVDMISYSAFQGCRKLVSVTINSDFTMIDSDAFAWCVNLQTIYCTQAVYDKYHKTFPQMVVEGVDNSYTQITFQKQYGAMNFTPEDDYESVVFEFDEQPYEVQVTITSDLFEKEESWGDAYYAAYFPAQYYLNGNTIRLNLNDVFYDNFAGLVNDRGETASKITTIAIQNAADGENVVYLKSVTFVKNDGSTVVLKNSEDGFDFEMEVIK